MATAKNGLKSGCPLYDTKPENIPAILSSAIDVAEDLRELKALDMLPSLDDITAWEFCCYRTAERAVRKIEAERQDKDKETANPTPTEQPPGDSGAFGKWENGG